MTAGLLHEAATRLAEAAERYAVPRIEVGRRLKDVLFLTGRPMQDRAGDFRTLVELLDSGAEIRPEEAVLGPDAFRAAVAPVYLRRERRDVLAELPDIVDVTERWTGWMRAARPW